MDYIIGHSQKVDGVGIYSEISSNTCAIKRNDKFKLNDGNVVISIKELGYRPCDIYRSEIPIGDGHEYYIITSALHSKAFKDNDILYKIN